MSHVNPESDAHPRSPGAAGSFQSFRVSLLPSLEILPSLVLGTEHTLHSPLSLLTSRFRDLFNLIDSCIAF